MKVTTDLHIHTELSECAKPGATLENYLVKCREYGITTMGIADHTWAGELNRDCGWANWYKRQTLEKILNLRNELPETGDVRVLIGCEVEYLGDGVVGMTDEARVLFDFVLLPASHFHQWGFTVPEDFKNSSVQTVQDLLRKRFLEVCNIKCITGICHPFIPFGFFDHEAEIISGISDEQFTECFEAAAEGGLSIEIHHHAACSKIALDGKFSSEYVRMLSIAKKCGCVFYFGSDAHHPDKLKNYDHMGAFAAACGITEADLLVI